MGSYKITQTFKHFSKYLFRISRVFVERRKARVDVNNQIQRMRKSIISMRLTYTDVDKLKEKIERLIGWERKFARFFTQEDRETQELKTQVKALEHELRQERQEKERVITSNQEKINQLSDSLNNLKASMKSLYIDKARRLQRLKALEQKIVENVDPHHYYSS